MDLRIKAIPEEHQKGDEWYAVVDWDWEPGIPLADFATREQAEEWIRQMAYEWPQLEEVRPKLEEFVTMLAEEWGINRWTIAEQVSSDGIQIADAERKINTGKE